MRRHLPRSSSPLCSFGLALLIAGAVAWPLAASALAASDDVAPPAVVAALEKQWPYAQLWLPDVPYYHYLSWRHGRDGQGKTFTITFASGHRHADWHIRVLPRGTGCASLYGATRSRRLGATKLYYAPGSPAKAWACSVQLAPDGRYQATVLFELDAAGWSAKQLLDVLADAPNHGWTPDQGTD